MVTLVHLLLICVYLQVFGDLGTLTLHLFVLTGQYLLTVGHTLLTCVYSTLSGDLGAPILDLCVLTFVWSPWCTNS